VNQIGQLALISDIKTREEFNETNFSSVNLEELLSKPIQRLLEYQSFLSNFILIFKDNGSFESSSRRLNRCLLYINTVKKKNPTRLQKSISKY